MDRICDLGMLIERIDEGLSIRRKDIGAGSAFLDGFYYDPGSSLCDHIRSLEPGSTASYEAQMKYIYEPIAQRAHSVSLEGLDTPVEDAICPFPFNLSPRDAGYWTMAYGSLELLGSTDGFECSRNRKWSWRLNRSARQGPPHCNSS